MEQMVSVIGSSYFQPIADLIERWSIRAMPKPSEVQSGYYEQGYAASVILLLVAMFESYVVRMWYVGGHTQEKKRTSVMEKLIRSYPNLDNQASLADVYVLRDTIIHNHPWAIDFSWGTASTMVVHGATIQPGFGDKKYLDRVDPNTMRTKTLGLSVIPTRVDRKDARKVFETIWDTLLFIENQDRNQCYVSHLPVRYNGKPLLFGRLIDELRYEG